MAMSGIAIPERVVDGELIQVGTHDNAHLLLDFGDARYAVITTGFTMQRYKVPGIELYGTEGTIQMIGEDWAPAGYEMWQNSAGCWQVFDEGLSWPWTDGIRHMIECIETGTPPVITPEHAYHVLEIMLKSMESGRHRAGNPDREHLHPAALRRRLDARSRRTSGPRSGRRDMTYKPSPRPTFDEASRHSLRGHHPPSLGRRGRGRSGGLDLCLQRPHSSARLRAAAGRRFPSLRLLPHRLRRRRRLLRAERDPGDRQSGHRRGAAPGARRSRVFPPRHLASRLQLQHRTVAGAGVLRASTLSGDLRRLRARPALPRSGGSSLRPRRAGWGAGQRPRAEESSQPHDPSHPSGRRPLAIWKGGSVHSWSALLVSTEHLTVGRIDLLPGQRSDVECHGGDEAIYVLSGTVHRSSARRIGRRAGWSFGERDGCYLPAGTPHQYYNIGGDAGVAPVRRRAVLPVRGARKWTRRAAPDEDWGIGIDVGGTKIAAGAVDAWEWSSARSGTRCPPDRSAARSQCSPTIEMLADLHRERVRRNAVVAIGIGVPEAGRVRRDISATPISSIGQRYRWRRGSSAIAPTVIAADVRAAALAEAGTAPVVEFDSFAYISIGSGISSTVVQDGVPLPGRTRRSTRPLFWLVRVCPAPSAAPGPSSSWKTTPRVRRWHGATPRPPVAPSKEPPR